MTAVATVTRAQAGEALRRNEEAHGAWATAVLEGRDVTTTVAAARECERAYRELYDLVMLMTGDQPEGMTT